MAWHAYLTPRLALLYVGLSCGLGLPTLASETPEWGPTRDLGSVLAGRHILHYPHSWPLLGQPGGTYVHVWTPMHGNMCVCVEVCMGVHVHVHAHLYECDVKIDVHVCVCVCAWEYMQWREHECECVHGCECAYVCLCVGVSVCPFE